MAMRVVNARARAPSMFSQGSPRASFLGAPQTRALSTARNVSQTHQACETTRRSASATRSAVGASAFFPTARPLHASALGARRSFSSARELRETAWAMPLDSPSYPQSSFVYREREFLSITYRTDRRSLEAVVPAPLEIPDDNLVRYEFSNVPDSTGFGVYSIAMQQIPVLYNGELGRYIHAFYVDDDAPIAAGREIWGLPAKLAEPSLANEKDSIVGNLKIGSVLAATASMGFKHTNADASLRLQSMRRPVFSLKIIPDVDCKKPRILQLVRTSYTDIHVHGSWTGPAALSIFSHSAHHNDLPVNEIVGAAHWVADLTLGPGEVVKDYLKHN